MGKELLIRNYIKEWERKSYPKGIPDEAPFELEKRGVVPSYRLICLALMKNENNLESLGISRTKCNVYQEMKRIEIEARPTKYKQLKLF